MSSSAVSPALCRVKVLAPFPGQGGAVGGIGEVQRLVAQLLLGDVIDQLHILVPHNRGAVLVELSIPQQVGDLAVLIPVAVFPGDAAVAAGVGLVVRVAVDAAVQPQRRLPPILQMELQVQLAVQVRRPGEGDALHRGVGGLGVTGGKVQRLGLPRGKEGHGAVFHQGVVAGFPGPGQQVLLHVQGVGGGARGLGDGQAVQGQGQLLLVFAPQQLGDSQVQGGPVQGPGAGHVAAVGGGAGLLLKVHRRGGEVLLPALPGDGPRHSGGVGEAAPPPGR